MSLRLIVIFIQLISIPFILWSQNGFKSNQLQYERVKKAYELKEKNLTELLDTKGIQQMNLEMCLIAYKKDKELELWVRKKGTQKYQLLKTYDFCSSSGTLGPKRKQGDGQIPEGIYHINRFNPYSSFHLSLGLNYPNQSDRIAGDKTNPGGDIFIHGSCVTIGCIPITDDKIREVYLLAVEAKNKGQDKIPVMIFPFRMNEKNMKENESSYSEDETAFWRNLKTAYDYFIENYNIPHFTIDTKGKYVF